MKKQVKKHKFVPSNIENAIVDAGADIFVSEPELSEFDKIRKKRAKEFGYPFVPIVDIIRNANEEERREKEQREKSKTVSEDDFYGQLCFA